MSRWDLLLSLDAKAGPMRLSTLAKDEPSGPPEASAQRRSEDSPLSAPGIARTGEGCRGRLATDESSTEPNVVVMPGVAPLLASTRAAIAVTQPSRPKTRILSPFEWSGGIAGYGADPCDRGSFGYGAAASSTWRL